MLFTTLRVRVEQALAYLDNKILELGTKIL